MIQRTIFLAVALLSGLLFFMPAQQAKTMPPASAAYVAQMTKRLDTLQDFYKTSNNWVWNTANITDVRESYHVLSATVKAENAITPPLDLLALHSQYLFAAQRCENLSLYPSLYITPGNIKPFDLAPMFIEKENCTNQIQATRLRLIDYATGYGVNPLKQ